MTKMRARVTSVKYACGIAQPGSSSLPGTPLTLFLRPFGDGCDQGDPLRAALDSQVFSAVDGGLESLPTAPMWGTLPTMGRRSKLCTLSIGVAIAAVVVLALVLRKDLRCAGFAGPGVVTDELPPPAAAGRLRVATWNLRNFPLDERPQYPDLGYSRRTNICDLEAAIAGLDADVIGFSEITDARRFPPILRRASGDRFYKVAVSRHGGRRAQRLAIAWDSGALDLVGSPVEILEVALTRDLRPALAVTLRRVTDGLQFTVVQVHLKSRRDGFDSRMRQHRQLLEWTERWSAEAGRRELIIMGDFNTTGPEAGSPRDEMAAVDALYEAAGLHRLANLTGCTEYWEGGGAPDGVQVASLLDLVFVGGFPGVVTDARSWLHCARYRCDDLVSRPGQEDGTFWDVSDHCPVTFEVSLDR